MDAAALEVSESRSPLPPSLAALPLCQPWFSDTYADAVRAQVLSGWVGPGAASEQLAAELASRAGTAHALLTVSGTAALSIAAVALGLRPGDEILVPAYGVISTINAFAVLGLVPRLVDIDRASGCLAPAALARRIRPETRAVCFVNFSGATGPQLAEVSQLCTRKGLPLIEDAACALGHHFRGKAAGSFGTVGIYSFSVPKIVSTGQGGALVTESGEVHERAGAYVDHGAGNWRKTNLVRSVGTNLRFNDILASFGLAQLKDLPLRIARKRAVYEVLRQQLGRRLFQVPGEVPPLHNIVFTRERSRLLEFLGGQRIGAVCPYRTLCEHPAYAALGDGEFPNADFWTRHSVYLPFGLAMTPADAYRLARAVREANVPLFDCP